MIVVDPGNSGGVTMYPPIAAVVLYMPKIQRPGAASRRAFETYSN
jgi:hypothetical protein